jgi:uncharacterized protein (TIGR02246 family)
MTELSDHDQIRQLLAAYCQTCDDGRFDDFAQLFAEDAHFIVMGETHVGRAEIQVWMAGAQPPELRGKHMLSEPAIAVADDGASADVRTDYAFVGKGGGRLTITSAGRYVDRLVRSADGQWRFASREIVFLVDPRAT